MTLPGGTYAGEDMLRGRELPHATASCAREAKTAAQKNPRKAAEMQRGAVLAAGDDDGRRGGRGAVFQKWW